MSKRVIHSMIFGARTGIVADAVFASEAQRRRENQDERRRVAQALGRPVDCCCTTGEMVNELRERAGVWSWDGYIPPVLAAS